MAFSWKKFSVFGIVLAIPAVIFVVKKAEAAIFEKHSRVLAECDRCRKMLGMAAGVRLIMHLQEDHGIGEDDAIRIVEDVYRRFFRREK